MNSNPILVEPNIKYIMNMQLNTCKQYKFIQNSGVLNTILFMFLCSLLGFILFIKYKGKQDVRSFIERDNKKKKYILSKLQTFQRIKAKEYTNIPI